MTARAGLRRAWAGLLRTFEPPVPAAVASYVASVGAEEAWCRVAEGTAPASVARIAAPRIARLGAAELHDHAEADLAAARATGADIAGPETPGWPTEALARLAAVRPYDRATAASPPLAWYVRGSGWPVGETGAVAIVGSRAATPYGVRVAAELAAAAVDDGYLVVSGAAFGIDAAAHRGALSGAGSAVTVAVSAAGIDRPYPAAHRALLDAIADCGAVISEYPPGAVPARHRFLVRNRLIAALSGATIVVEAGRRSGSLNTAGTAANIGRQVFAVPGPVTSAMSVGCHDLIAEHKAGIAVGWPSIATLLGPIRPDPSPHRRGDRPADGLDLIGARVYEALPARGTVAVDAIAVEAALPVPVVLGALAQLEMHDLAVRVGGGWACTHVTPPSAGGASA